MKTLVKVIGKSGQVSFGKEHAGRQVLIEQTAPGEWRVRTATVIPDSEKWLHAPDMAQSLERALNRAAAEYLEKLNWFLAHSRVTTRESRDAGISQP